MARTPTLLLVVYETRRERLAFSIRTLRSRRHSLTVFRDYGSTRRIVFSVCLLRNGGEGICVHLLHGDGISHGAPVTLVSLPSYLTVTVELIGVPSAWTPVVVALAPPSIASRVLVRLLMGIGAGVYFDFATARFQVPMVLSAPNAATVVIARAIIALVRIVRICQAPLNFGGTW